MSQETEQPQGLVTIKDLYQVVKLLEDLATLKRLTSAEIEHVKPAFDNIVAFLAEYEKTQAAAANAPATVESDLIDLSNEEQKPVVKNKKSTAVKKAKGKK